MAKKRDKAKEKANREAKIKALEAEPDALEEDHTNADEAVDTTPPRRLRSAKLLVGQQPRYSSRNAQVYDRAAEGGTRDSATAAVNDNATKESEDGFAIQARTGGDKHEDVTGEANHNIEGTFHSDQPGKPNIELNGGLSGARRGRNRTAVARDKSKEVIGNAAPVQENMDEAKVGKAKPIAKRMPRKPPWNKGLKMKKVLVGERVHDETKRPPRNRALKSKKASTKDQVGNSTFIADVFAAVEEGVHDESVTAYNEVDYENIIDNATRVGELNTKAHGLADDEETGVYNDQASRDAGGDHNIGKLESDVPGITDDEDARMYHHGDFYHDGDEDNFADDEDAGAYLPKSFRTVSIEDNIAHDEDARVYNQENFRDAGDEDNIVDDEDAGVYHPEIFRDAGSEDHITDDKDAGVYHQGDMRDAGDDNNIGDLKTEVAGDDDVGVYQHGPFNGVGYDDGIRELNPASADIPNNEDSGVYEHGHLNDMSDEDNVRELNPDPPSVADDEDTGLYQHGPFNDISDEDNVGEPNPNSPGVADNEDTGMYQDGAFGDAGDEDNVSELNRDSEVADDEDSGLYEQGAFRNAGEENTVRLNPDSAGVVDAEHSGVYEQGAFRDTGVEDNVSEQNTDSAGVAGDEHNGVYEQGAFYDTGREDNISQQNTDPASVAIDEDTGVYEQGAFGDAGSEDNVSQRNTDPAGVAYDEDTGMYEQGVIRDAGGEDNVSKLDTDSTSVAVDENNRVYEQGAFGDAGDENNVSELNSNTTGVADDEDTVKYHRRAISTVCELDTDVIDEALGIHDSHAFHHGSDEPMGDALSDFLDHSSRDDSSDLTSYNTDSYSPNIIAKEIGCPEGYAGMELPDQIMGEPKDILFSDVNDVIMGEVADGFERGAEAGSGATALIGTERRQRKRKAPDSDKVTTNDEDATDDANCFVRAEQAAKSKNPPRKRKVLHQGVADGEGNMDRDDMRIEDSHRDSKTTKFSRKRRAPMGEISGKEETGRRHIADEKLGADRKKEAFIGESSTSTVAKKPGRKQFWYYQPITDDKPKPVDLDEQLAISLGAIRASRLRRPSGNNLGKEGSARENSVGAPKREQKPRTSTRGTGKEAVRKKAPAATTTSNRKRNSDDTSITKHLQAYPEDGCMMTNELEAASAEEPQAEAGTVIDQIQVHKGSMVGFRDGKGESVQDQLPSSGQVDLNQGTVAITVERLIEAPKIMERKRASKKKQPLVQSDALHEVLEGANKDQVTSRPRKRKPLKLGFSAHEEPTSGLVGEAVLEEQGASIAASRPKRKRAPTGKDYFPSHDLSFEDLHDEHDEHDAGEAERATSIGGDRPPQKPKALTGESSARNGGHELGSSENGAGWAPNGEKPKASEAELEFSPGKKNPKKVVRPKVDIWDYNYLVTNPKSKLVEADLLSLFQKPETWALLSQEELEELQPHFPEYVPRNDDNLTISTDWLRNDVDWRHSVRTWQAELGGGFFDPVWQKQAAAASAERAAGKYDRWKEEEFEEFWGQKQAPPDLASL